MMESGLCMTEGESLKERLQSIEITDYDVTERKVDSHILNSINQATEIQSSDNDFKTSKESNNPRDYTQTKEVFDKNKEKILTTDKNQIKQGSFEVMKQNYENEIYALKKQLQDVGLHGLSSEETLLTRCYTLDLQLRRSKNEEELLAEQVRGLKSQLTMLPDRIRVLEQENEVLVGRIADVRAINVQRQNEVDWLHDIVRALETKLYDRSICCYPREMTMLENLKEDYDNVMEEYNRLQMKAMATERKLYEAETKISCLSSDFLHLEMKCKNLNNENDFWKGMVLSEDSKKSYNPRYNQYTEDITTPVKRSIDQSVDNNDDASINGGDLSLRKDPQFQYFKENQKHTKSSNICYNVLQEKYLSNMITPTTVRPRQLIFTNMNDVTKESLGSVEFRRNSGHTDRSNNGIKSNHYSSTEEPLTTHQPDLDKQYLQLQKEKNILLISLGHIPTVSSPRNKKTNKDRRENLETQLDRIDRQLGMIRMTFKRQTILK